MLELPTWSTQTAMNTRSSMLSKYIDAKQSRRRKAKYHQKRLNMGLPAAVPLKHVSLNQEEKETIASTEVIGTARQKKLFVTRHFGWPVSLGFHAFAGFLLTIYAVKEYIPEPPPVSLDFVEPIRERRDIRRRSPIKPTKPPDTLQIQPQRVQRMRQVIEIPKEEAQLHTLGGDLTPTDDAPTVGNIDIPKGLDVQVEQKRVQIVDDAPKVNIDRTASIAPEDSEIGDADIGLKEPSIEVEVAVEVDQQPRVLRKVEPKYPEAARRAQREGVVELEFTVGVDGRATDIKVSKSAGGFGFDDAAIDAVKKWRFTPAKRGNESVPQRVKIPIRFSLKD